jgi:hypothetical protein
MIKVQTTPLVVCDVCRILESDLTLKYCDYCGLCDSWICKQDQEAWWRRTKAFWKRRVEPNFRGDPNYIKSEGEPPSP